MIDPSKKIGLYNSCYRGKIFRIWTELSENGKSTTNLTVTDQTYILSIAMQMLLRELDF